MSINRAAERAATAFDSSRRASFLGVWEIPFFKAQKGPVGRIFGGWQLSGTMILQSGQPFSVTQGAAFLEETTTPTVLREIGRITLRSR